MRRFLSRFDTPLFFWLGVFTGLVVMLVAQMLTLAILSILNT